MKSMSTMITMIRTYEYERKDGGNEERDRCSEVGQAQQQHIILHSPLAIVGGRRKEDAQQNFWPAAKNVARPKSRVALRATSLAAAVAQNGYFDPNVAPAQQRNS